VPGWTDEEIYWHAGAMASDNNSRSVSNPSNMALNIQLLAHSLPNLQDSNGFICCSLLAFSVAEASETLPSEDTVQVHSSVLILNIALAYHRKGGSGNEASLAMAEQMNGVVTKLLSGCEHNQGVALVAKLASMNYLSVLQRNQGCHNLAQHGFQHLGDLIDIAGVNLGRSPLCSAQMYEGMLLNILCIASPDATPAA
jgi:hypothetical protein